MCVCLLAPVLFNLFFDTVIAAAGLAHPSSSVRMLFNLDGPLVGGRKKMRREVGIRDLEYVDMWMTSSVLRIFSNVSIVTTP